MEVDYFQILLIDITFNFQHVEKLIGNMLIKNVKKRYNRYRRFNPFKPEFTIGIFIHYKPQIAVAIHDL